MEDKVEEEHYTHERRFPRFPFNRVVKYTRSDGAGPERILGIVNISKAGLQFSSYQRIEPDTMLKMKLDLPEKNCSLLLDGRVIWSHEDPDEKGIYYSGVSFPDLKGDLRSLIL